MYKDLVGTRKEAKEPLAKFNARDESRSRLPLDGKKRHQKSLHSSLSHSLNPPKFRSHSHLIQHCKKCGGGLTFLNIKYLPKIHLFRKIFSYKGFILDSYVSEHRNKISPRKNRSEKTIIKCC